MTMNPLADKSCEACRSGAPLATQEEIEEYLPQKLDQPAKFLP